MWLLWEMRVAKAVVFKLRRDHTFEVLPSISVGDRG